MKGFGLRKSLLSLIVFQLSLMFILVREKVPSHYIFDIWIFPLALLLVFLLMGIKGTAGELLAGWFFLGLIGFGFATKVPWIARPLVFVVSALWFLLYLELEDVDLAGYLAKVILNLTPWKRRFLVIVTGFSVLAFTFKLLNDSPMSVWERFFVGLVYLVIFLALLMSSKKCGDMNCRKSALRFSVLVFIFIGIYVKVRNDVGFILQVIVVPFLWTVLLALVGFSNMCPQEGDNGTSVRGG